MSPAPVFSVRLQSLPIVLVLMAIGGGSLAGPLSARAEPPRDRGVPAATAEATVPTAAGDRTQPDTVPVVTRTTLVSELPEVSDAPPGLTVAEPTVVADPDDPERIAVAAMVEHRTRGDASQDHPSHSSTRVWVSDDGARTWSDGQDLLPGFSGITADLRGPDQQELSDGDPTITVLPDGRFSVAVVLTEWRDMSKETLPDTGSGPYEGVLVATQSGGDSAFRRRTRIGLSDLPRPPYSFPHVPTLVADRWTSSPHQGTLYLSYFARMGQEGDLEHAVFFKTSRDGGESFGPPKVLPKSREYFPNSDAIVGPDGTAHLLVTRDSTEAFYLTSPDGGRSFSEPRPVAIDRPTTNNHPHLAIGHSGKNRGRILGTFNQRFAEDADHSRGAVAVPIGHGAPVAPPRRVDPDLQPDQRVRLPAPAVSGDASWVLAYREGDGGTEVVLYRSTDGGRSWDESRVLATRPTHDFRVGDYVGLAAAGDRLYAAYPLPSGDPDRPVELYVSVIELRS